MKKLFNLVAGSALAFTTSVNAQYVEDTNNMAEIITIEEVRALPDDTMVRVKGKLSKKIGNEKYELTDDSQMIIVEIDDEDFNGQKVTAQDIIIIAGEIDKEMLSPAEIDVESIEIVNIPTTK